MTRGGEDSTTRRGYFLLMVDEGPRAVRRNCLQGATSKNKWYYYYYYFLWCAVLLVVRQHGSESSCVDFVLGIRLQMCVWKEWRLEDDGVGEG